MIQLWSFNSQKWNMKIIQSYDSLNIYCVRVHPCYAHTNESMPEPAVQLHLTPTTLGFIKQTQKLALRYRNYH
jgi:hypothetical protein